jgi:cephalosporin-C deacetylase-like acetyl esterase
MPRSSFSDQLALWGVDRAPAEAGMLLDFIERLATRQPVPAPARTLDELEARRLPLQMRLRYSLGLNPWPEKTNLNPRSVGKLQKNGYVIEKLVYEAWSGLPISAHLYLPNPVKPPCPGLVYACGHWMEAGKLAPLVQSFCASAASMGIVTLVYDPIGQGERLVSWREHGNLSGLLIGKCQLGGMVWESIRALDYLCGRPEVDPAKICMTGASGGGLNTLFTTAIDDRFACAIPVAYPCTFSAAMQAERDLNWEDGTDLCNQVPQVMSYAEMSDIASLFLPKPYLVLAGRRDKIFPIEGTREIASTLEKNYTLAGFPERFRYVEADEEHGYPLSLRQAAYGWLKRWLLEDGDGSPVPEPELDLFPDPYPVEYSTPPRSVPGNVHSQSPTLNPVPGAEPAFCFSSRQAVNSETVIGEKIRVAAVGMERKRPFPTRSDELAGWQETTRSQIRAILGPFPEKPALRTRLFNQVWANGVLAERVTFQSEDGIHIPGCLILPQKWDRPLPVLIYVGEWGKGQGNQSGLIGRMVKAGYGVLAVDVRGVGETAASEFEAATNCLMMDRPLFAQRVWDVIRAVDFLWERCYIAPQLDKGRLVILGEGVGGLWSLYAAALDERVAAAVALDTLYSYQALLEPGASAPASVYLFDILGHFDLSDVIAACAPRPVYLRPVDGRRRLRQAALVAAALWRASRAFGYSGAGRGGFRITSSRNHKDLIRWLDKVLQSAA